LTDIDTSSDTPADRDIPAGIGWMVLTGILFVSVTGIVRYLGSDMPAIEAAFLRYAIGLALVTPVLLRMVRNPPGKDDMKLYIFRGGVHGIAVILWFYAMARIPIAEVTAIGYVSPIFVTIGAALVLGERLHLRRIVGVLVGLVGTLIIIRPGFQEVNIGQLAQLVAAPLFATSYILAKKMTSRADPGTIVGMLTLFCTLALLPGAILQWRTPTTEELLWLTLTALFATIGHYTLTRAFRAAPITVTQPFAFLQLIWAALLGITLFGEQLDLYVMIGGALIVIAVTYISHREAAAARRQVTPPPQAMKF
jgi:drug/metabolite transporter (DMT)-like permease